jgi:hypothetical protein
MMRECFNVTDVNLSQEQIERGDYSANFLDWRIFKIKRDGKRVKKPIVATVDAKLLRDAYPPNEVINAMMQYLTTIYDSHDLLQVRSRGYLTYPSWFSPLFQDERPKMLPGLTLIKTEFTASKSDNPITNNNKIGN